MARGLPLASSIEIGSLEVIKLAVQQGLGIAIVPQIATRAIPDGTVVRTIDDWELHLPIGLITKTIPLPQGKAIQSFRTLLKQAIDK